MSNAVHKQQSDLEAKLERPGVEDDIAEDLHARIIGLELELQRVRAEIASMRAGSAAREDRTNGVLEIYRKLISDLTSVLEAQRGNPLRAEPNPPEARSDTVPGARREPAMVPVAERADRRASWPRRLFE